MPSETDFLPWLDLHQQRQGAHHGKCRPADRCGQYDGDLEEYECEHATDQQANELADPIIFRRLVG